MSVEVNKSNWAKILKFFSDQNRGRLTRLGVCERGGENGGARREEDWIESGLPLAGIDADTHDGNRAAVEIMLGDAARDETRHFTHCVRNVNHVRLHFSPDGHDDQVKIEDADGATTVLRFEN